MISLTTTYRHDFLWPSVHKKDFEKISKFGPMAGFDPCICEEHFKRPDLSKLAASCPSPEWTGVAAMGALINPRIIPEEPKDDRKINACFQDKPNKFLEKLCLKFPELYEKLRAAPHDDLYSKIDLDRFKSTYQVDYCRIPLGTQGVYDDLTTKATASQSDGIVTEDPCAIYRERRRSSDEKYTDSDPCIGLYRPVKVTCITNVPRSYISSGHWGSSRAVIVGMPKTEYQSKIGETGRIIQEKKFNDHSKCAEGSNCNHEYEIKPED